jgi:hypothetical protein
MATWHGAPLGDFVDEQFLSEVITPFEINSKWLPGHETECNFAKLNSEVLTIIHEEKRFPTREELRKIRDENVPPVTFSFQDLADMVVPLTWDEIEALDNKKQACWGYIDSPSISYEPKYEAKFTEPECPWNGISYDDFIKSDPPTSALASTKGVNKHNLNHRLI